MRLGLLSLPLLALVGCAETNGAPDAKDPRDGCDPVTRWEDVDGDGFGDPDHPFEGCDPEHGADNADDCDDGDATIHPGAEEDCTVEVDANCDGSMGYADADADGTPACEDCDDADAGRNPSAAEFCDDVDQDCDGAVDDHPVDGRYFYADTDGDGHGAEDAYVRACEAPDGYLEDVSDCDDADAEVHPGATELCDGVDNDCDGATDGDDAADAPLWYADRDGDGWGDDADTVQSCDEPRRYAADAGDCDDTDPAVSPAATETCNGVDDDCDGGTDDDEAADASSWFVDADGDGHGDPGTTLLACELPAGAAATGDDCDDADATAFPGAPESCDDVDDDCDGTVDEDPVDAPTWYGDADADGFGDPAATTVTCDAPAGTVSIGTDCDDADATLSPAAAETCNGVDDDCDGSADEGATDAATWYADLDGDGFGDAGVATAACDQPAGTAALATDCDDADAAEHPGATETCDGDDDDCDGTADEPDATDAGTWYADADADGFGDPDAATTACEAPAGTVASATDCDDSSARFHPGAAETDCADPADYNCDGSVGYADADADGYAACEECDDADGDVLPGAAETCNAIDDDCDGAVDEDATGGLPWYADADGDGYGDADAVASACEAPTGYVADATDCDDTTDAVSPAATESCATAADDDCDGDDNDRNATGCTRFYWDYDGDGYGSTSNACYCEATGYLTADDDEDCDDGNAGAYPGGVEDWSNDVDDDCDGVTDVVTARDDADAELYGENAADAASYSMAPLGDLNGDGYGDLVIGAYQADGGGSESGGAYVVYGPVSGAFALVDAEAELVGEAAGDDAGTSVASAGDVDGDGIGDLVVGAPDAGASDAGAAYLVYGSVSGTLDLGAAEGTFTGTARNEAVGSAVAGGWDLDGDALPDLLVGAPAASTGGSGSGSAYVVSGLITGSRSTAGASLVGEDPGDYAGSAVAVAEDVNGDGAADALVVAYGDDSGGTSSGSAYVLFGPLSGTIDLSTADAKLVGEAANDTVSSIDAPGDLDGDGLGDVLVGAYGGGPGGRAYVVSAPSGTVDLSDAGATLSADTASINAGYDVAGAGDVDGDGFRDVLVGANLADDPASDAGAAWLVLGPLAGSYTLGEDGPTFLGAAATDYLGATVSTAGDVDGDGLDDFLLGAWAADTGGGNAGSAYLFYGR